MRVKYWDEPSCDYSGGSQLRGFEQSAAHESMSQDFRHRPVGHDRSEFLMPLRGSPSHSNTEPEMKVAKWQNLVFIENSIVRDITNALPSEASMAVKA